MADTSELQARAWREARIDLAAAFRLTPASPLKRILDREEPAYAR